MESTKRNPLNKEPIKTSSVLDKSGSTAYGKARSAAKTRIFCFPFNAGTANMYKDWPDTYQFVEIYPVQYPGHGTRLDEEPINNLSQLVEKLAYELFPCDKNFIFFGYSLGALVAYELAVYIKKHLKIEPKALIVAAEEGPQFIGKYDFNPLGETDLDKEKLQKMINDLFNIPENLRNEETLLKIIKSDLMLEYNYTSNHEQLTCPVISYWGKKDQMSKESAQNWKIITKGSFTFFEIDGGHLFIDEVYDFYKMLAPLFGRYM